MITDFFKQLAKYYDHENDLSNVTCALCESSEFFREKFIHFFFPEIDINQIRSIEREVPDENDMHSRVDLLISMENDTMPYLIEVKIYDQNHHFGQYEDAYKIPKERLGYITNYYCFEGIEKGYDVKTWKDWIKTLEQSVDNAENADEKSQIEGYIEYVNRVCGFSKIVSSLDFSTERDQDFTNIVKWAINGGGMNLKCRTTTRLYKEHEYNAETFFFYPNENLELGGFCGYIGVNEKPVICLGFCRTLQKHKPVYKVLHSKGFPKSEWTEDVISLKYFSSPTIIIPLSEEKQKLFLKCQNASEQAKVISDFIDFVLNNIVQELQ